MDLTRCCVGTPEELPAHGIPERYLQVTRISELQHEPLRRVATRYLSRFFALGSAGHAPLLLGKGGTMKTFTLALITARLHYKLLLPVRWVSCADELPALERRRYDPETNRTLEHLKTVPFLALDDPTRLREGSWMMEFVDEVLEARYNNQRPTGITANLLISRDDVAPLQQRFGVPLARRILEGADGLTVVMR